MKTRIKKYLRRILTLLIALAFLYVLLEIVFTAYERFYGEPFFYLVESPDGSPAVTFDPAQGYRFSQAPARRAVVAFGKLDFQVTNKGNNRGFLDDDDFYPAKKDPNQKRILVFGDSYTSAMHLSKNWPILAESYCKSKGHNVQFMNLALDGIGIANWYNIIQKIVIAENVEYDGVVFASFMDNFNRKFTFADATEFSRWRFGRARTWNPYEQPTSFEEAKKLLYSPPIYVVTTAQFDSLIQKRRSPFRLAFYGNARTVLWFYTSVLTAENDLSSERLQIMLKTAQWIKSHKKPTMLAFVPFKPEDFQDAKTRYDDCCSQANSTDFDLFRELSGATFFDFCEVYKGRTPEQIKTMWMNFDPHLSEEGSRVLAERVSDYFLKVLP